MQAQKGSRTFFKFLNLFLLKFIEIAAIYHITAMKYISEQLKDHRLINFLNGPDAANI